MKIRIWMATYTLLAAVAAAQTTHYTVTDLGSIGGPPGQPFTVNSAGLVTGAAVRPDGTSHAMLWYKGTRMDLGTLGLRISNSLAYNVNDNGQVVGMADTFTTYPYREDFCGFKSFGLPTWGTECLPFVWQNGVMTPLPTLGGYNGMASWINNKGQIVGVAENAVRDTTCPAPQVLQQRPVLWDGGKAQELPLFAGDPDGSAFAINDSGQIVGASGTCSSFNQNSLSGLQPLHALLWQNGKATDMGNLGGTGHGAGVLALTLNAYGQAVGFSDLPGDKAYHAFTWTQTTGMQDLGALPGDVSSVALNINDAGIITGASFDATGNIRPFVFQNGVMTELNSLMPVNSPLYILLPCGINSSGQITGLAVLQSDGTVHGFLATPAVPSATEPREIAPVTLSDAVRDQVLRQLRFRGVNAVR